jgi:acyl-CoA synthetase (AMP-forming)/AMP-acid ligase II
VDHPDWGQEIVAVVAADSESRPSEESLLAQARGVLAPYKIPSRIVFVDEIPKAGPGKYRKGEILRSLTGGDR